MISLEKKLSGTLIYDKVEDHAAPAAGGLLGDTEKNPKRKIPTDPKEVRAFMRIHMQEIYKHQNNSIPEAENVISFLDVTKTRMSSTLYRA